MTVSGEIFPTHIRPQGVAWSLVGTFLSTLIYIEAAPTALANIKWGYYIIFIVLTLINIIVLCLWCPEVCLSSRRILSPCNSQLTSGIRRGACHSKRSMKSLATRLSFTSRTRRRNSVKILSTLYRLSLTKRILYQTPDSQEKPMTTHHEV